MKVTALVVVLGLVAGVLAAPAPEAVPTVFGNSAGTQQVLRNAEWITELKFARIGTEEFTTDFLNMNINGKAVLVGVGIKLSASGDDGRLQFRLHSTQGMGEEYDVKITGKYVLLTPEEKEYSTYPYSAPLSTRSPASQWVSTETKKVIEDKLLENGYLTFRIEFNY